MNFHGRENTAKPWRASVVRGGEIRLHTCFRSEGIPEGKILRSHGERLSSVAEKDAPMQTAAAKEHPKGEKGVDYLGKSVYNGLWIEKNLG